MALNQQPVLNALRGGGGGGLQESCKIGEPAVCIRLRLLPCNALQLADENVVLHFLCRTRLVANYQIFLCTGGVFASPDSSGV